MCSRSTRVVRVVLLVGMMQYGCIVDPQKGEVFTGLVTRVHDGDSIHITPAGKKRVVVRLGGIDAPEIDQAFGIQSRNKLRTLILNRQAEAQCHKQDKYQRQVCTVYANGEDINLQMLAAGLAWHYKHYQHEQGMRERGRYTTAQVTAQKNKLGLWAHSAVAPWEFRQQQR